MNPKLDLLQPYPFEKLAKLKAEVTANSALEHIPLSIGEPQHKTPDFILESIKDNLAGIGKYPATKGSLELRTSIANWLTQRFNLGADTVAPNRHVLPVNGTREALFAFAQAVVDNTRPNPIVLSPNPFYQIYEGAALLAGAKPVFINATADSGFLPDFDLIDEETWQDTQLLYLCSPSNPTGAVFELHQLEKILQLADTYDFVIAQDECYSELYYDESTPPLGLLEACKKLGRDDFSRCVVFHSLSKRSNAPGLRSGFVAGDEHIIEKFLKYRTYHGCAMSLTQQAASTIAWQDESHVIDNRAQYRQKFDAAKSILGDVQNITIPEAGFYIWLATNGCEQKFARDLFAEFNVTVLPGSYLSRESNNINPGSGYVRLALVAENKLCIEALNRIKEFITKFK